MNKKLAAYVLLPVLGVSLFGFSGAAHAFFGGPTVSPDDFATQTSDSFTRTANLLGISVDLVKQGWAEGKTIPEIAEANGVSKDALQTKMKAAHTEALKNNLQTLVSKGIITQAQADARLKAMESSDRTPGSRHHGMMRGWF